VNTHKGGSISSHIEMEIADNDLLSIPEFIDETNNNIYQSIGDIVRSTMDMTTEEIPDIPTIIEDNAPPKQQYAHPLWNENQLDILKSEAMQMRDSLVECVNNITNYRILTTQHTIITESLLNDIETLKLLCNMDERKETQEIIQRNLETLTILPETFSFVMALKDSAFRFMSNTYILSHFFGESSLEWAMNPELVHTYEIAKQLHVFIHYECMAYIVLNYIDELTFDIKSCLTKISL
jgi:hypothetical protein